MKAKEKKRPSLLKATRKELARQAAILVLGFIVYGWVVLDSSPRLWVMILIFLATASILFIFRIRRGIWLPLWRTFMLVFLFSLLGGSVLYIYGGVLPENTRTIVFIATVIISLLGSAVYHLMWTIPHWRDTYEVNTHRKINLERGLFSVTIDWARRQPISAGFKSKWLPLLISAGIGLAAILKYYGDVQALVLSAIGILMFWAAFAMGLTELYNAYKLWQIERQIGQSLIIDAYAKEYGR